MGAVASDLATRNRELGWVISPELARATAEVYAPRHASEPHPGVEVVRDLGYGPHSRHRLDVFTEASSPPGGGLPVVVFVHGGNFVAGDKHTPGSPFYDNVGVWAARAGCVGVTMTYRLAPADRWPAGADDVRAAVGYLRRRCAEWGGDPERIVLVGASAGATHVADAVGRAAHDPEAVAPAGAVLLSGMYDLVAFGRAEVLAPYYGQDPARWSEASPLPALVRIHVPLMVAIAEYDPPAQQIQAHRLIGALVERDGCLPWTCFLPGHNHFSEVLHLGTDDHLFADQLRAFVSRCGHHDNPEDDR